MTDIDVSDDDVALFKDWLTKQPFLPMTDDKFIRAFIVSTKGSLQKAKVKFDQFFKVQQTFKEYFDDFEPKRIEKSIQNIAICNVPGEECTLVFAKLLSDDPTYASAIELFLLLYYNIQIQLWDNTVGNCHGVYIIDFSKVGLGHLKGFSPVLAEKIAKCVVSAIPIRFKSFHLVNLSTVPEWAVHTFIQFLPEKFKGRFVINSKLSDHVDMKYIPEDYGGLNRPVAYFHDHFLARLKFHRRNFQAEKAMREVASKIRPRDDQDTTATFKKLAID